MRVALLLFSVQIISTELGKDVCNKVTTFNAVCQQNSTIFILSVSPCLIDGNFQPIAISMYDQESQNFFHRKLVLHKEYCQLGNIMVAIYWNWKDKANCTNFYHKHYLNAKLYSVTKNENNSRSEKILFEADFPFFNYMCSLERYSREFFPQKICNDSRKVGEYAYACLIKEELVSGPKNGLYLLMFDSCTIPYSVSILVFYDINENPFMKTFTQDKTDTLLSSFQEGCGLHLEMNDHDMEVYNTNLIFVCTNSTSVHLLKGFFNTELSKNCPLTSCTYKSKRKQVCKGKWILAENQQVSAFMNVTIDICHDFPQVSLDMYVAVSENESRIYPFRQDGILRSNYDNGINGIVYLTPFHIGFSVLEKIPTNNGYLNLDGGNISLNVIDEGSRVFVLILRHFPGSRDGIPLLFTEYQLGRNVERKKNCLSHILEIKSNVPMKIGIVVAVVLVLLSVLLASIVYWRKHICHQRFGLPHLIITEDTSEDIEERM